MDNDRYSLAGKVALVTGGARSLGLAIAVRLAEAGADVAICDKWTEGFEDFNQAVTGFGRKALAIKTDVGVKAETDGLVASVSAAFGRIDILVNNAAVSPFFGPVSETTEEIWNKIMSVNLKGPFFLSQACAKIMGEKGGGAIINIASIAGLNPDPNLGVYSISKAGLISMTKLFAIEYGKKNIRVNAIAPTYVRTRFSKPIWGNPEMMKKIEKETPLGRIAEPAEVAELVLLLSCEATGFISGQTIQLSGGAIA